MNHLEQLQIEFKGSGQNVVFSHGTPTYSGEYHKVVDQLKLNYRCVLIDHLGFGHSPKPLNGNYSLAAHQRRFAETLISNGIRSFHLVVHDFGGVIALPLLFAADFEVLSLTILNSWYWPLIETEPQMKNQKFLVTSGFLPFLYRNFNFSAKFLIKMAWGTYSPLTKARHEHFISKFPTKNERSGTVGFLKALFEFDNPAWNETQKLSKINTPVQIVWGKADKFISQNNLLRWKHIFPQSKVIELEDVGHFVADEAPLLLANALLSFFK